MGIFSGLFKSRDKPKNRTAGSAYTFYMGGSTAGKTVTERSAMQMTAVYSCVRILAEAIAGLPLHLYRENAEGGKEKATNHPLYRLLHDEPNPEMSSFVFRETLMTHLLLWGNAYAQVIRNGKGEVIALYKWAMMDSTVTSTTSSGYDASFGVGWRKLSDTAGKYTGTTTATITVYAAAVDSYAVFKCIATDSDSTSNTYNSTFNDVATFIDNSDPIQVVITSTGGDVFKNGQGSTTLKAVVYQAGAEIDADGKGTYSWTKYNKDGVVDTSWGTSGTKTGKTLSVSNSDVTTKATFMVVVTI